PASDNSAGMVRKNWRSRKMKKAFPNQAGTQSGRNVPIQPSQRKRRKTGSMVAWPGSMIVQSMATNNRSRPRKGMRAKAYAGSEQEASVPSTTAPQRNRVFARYRQNGKALSASG